MGTPVRFTPGEAAAAVRKVTDGGGRPYAALLDHGTFELGCYMPRGEDDQRPHEQDEAYIVLSGAGRFQRGAEVVSFGPGDALFVAAGVEHRFVDFTSDLQLWVVFWGPTGGEAPES